MNPSHPTCGLQCWGVWCIPVTASVRWVIPPLHPRCLDWVIKYHICVCGRVGGNQKLSTFLWLSPAWQKRLDGKKMRFLMAPTETDSRLTWLVDMFCCFFSFKLPYWDDVDFNIVSFYHKRLTQPLRSLARTTGRPVEKTDVRHFIFWKLFLCSVDVWKNGIVWANLIVSVLAFCPQLHRGAPGWRWWGWVDGEWQVKMRPVNQQASLPNPFHLHPPGDMCHPPSGFAVLLNPPSTPTYTAKTWPLK